MSGTESAVDRAEAVVIDLEQKAEAITARQKQISVERQRISFHVYARSNPESKKLLYGLNAEAANFHGEAEAISAALVEARSRLAVAKRDEAAKEDRRQGGAQAAC